MRKIVVAEFISLDGVMQAPGGADEDTEGGFAQGGWTQPYWHDDIGAHFFEEITQSDALLLGRKTWQIHGGAFEPMTEGDPFGDVMNTMPKYVVSTSLSTAAAWRNSTLIKSNVTEEVARLKQQPGRDIAISGSGTLVQSLLPEGLIDELNLLIYPVVLGRGKRLFRDGSNLTLKLKQSKTSSSGVLLLTYQRA